ncbi:putative cyclin domain-containing protein [Helianthus annuus]|nr:putative cyclin domain-containing protein [Helianthus annuus]
MVSKQQNVPPQNPIFAIEDALFCDEQQQDFDFGCGFGSLEVLDPEDQILKDKDSNFTHFQQHLLWEEDELYTLLTKEKHIQLGCDESLMCLRKESVDWINRVSTHFGFVALTTVLAVNYYDKFLMTASFQKDKPWMNHLVAVACLSLASKVEEIQAPLLLDLQMQGSKFVFESKTVMKMELLVLSCLEWKMNPVTPLAFFDYVMRRLGLMTRSLHYEFLRRCERILLSVINDLRFQGFLPSVMAAAIMCIVSKEIEPDNAFDYRNQLMNILNISEENVEKCSKFIMDVSNNHGSCYFQTPKRKYSSVPSSPIGVVDTYFSSDNSNNSWAIASSVSPSPEVQFKRFRPQEQQMRLTPVNRTPINPLSF